MAVGHINPLKGYEDLIRAVGWMRSRGQLVNCVVVGQFLDSKMKFNEFIRQLTDDEGVEEQVKFVGGRSDIAECLSLADVFILPSRFEAFGMVAAEASAMMKPVV